MKFGLHFIHELPRPWAADSELQLFQNGLDQVELADRLGIDYAWAAEQHFVEEYSHSSAPEVFLAAASQRTTNIRLGHSVVLMPPGYNHPARVAERIATLDLVSHGRVEFGTGDSKSRLELEGFGIEANERHAMSREALAEVTNMLAMEPYQGFSGKHFSMPGRNVVPKPIQRPHPPLWIACSDDATIHLAAQLGIGVLTHGFFDTDEAARIVTDYYDTFKRECVPIGHAVNPNVAMLNPFYCHPIEEVAVQRGAADHGFLTFAVRHYYSFGRHRPGRTNLWATFQAVREEMGGDVPIWGSHSIGTPKQVADHIRAFEEVGVDQTMFLHQAGTMSHEDICDSLELFAREVMPEFHEHENERQQRKEEELAPFIEAAFERKRQQAPAVEREIATCDAYGLARPPMDTSSLSDRTRRVHDELERMKQIALRHNESPSS